MKNKKIYIVFSILLLVIILLTVTKEFQNDKEKQNGIPA